MTGLDQLERSLKAADPARAAGDDPAPDLLAEARAVMDHDPPARLVPVRCRRRRLVPLAATAGALAIGIAVAFAVLPGDDKAGLPRPVEAFAKQIDARKGVLHLRMSPARALPEPGLPDLPRLGYDDEIWLDLGGTGWRFARTTPDGPWGKGHTMEQYADERGTHTVVPGGLPKGGRLADQPPEDLKPDYLRDLSDLGVIAEPSELVRGGQLAVVGEETVNGRPAYMVAVRRNDPKIVPDTGDDIANVRIYIAKDDGDLLRVQYRTHAGLTEKDTPMRTVIQDYPVYEILPPTHENLALIRPH